MTEVEWEFVGSYQSRMPKPILDYSNMDRIEHSKVYRMVVPGGWLYKNLYLGSDYKPRYEASICFVPEPINERD